MLAGTASAGTVVLTCSCPSTILHNNVTFTLKNTGNDTASNLVLTPHIENAKLSQSSYTLSGIEENSTTHFSIGISNISVPGTYSDYFILAYEQGSGQAFTALFPCLLNMGNMTISEVFVTTNVIEKGGSSDVNVSLFNAGSQGLTVNVSMSLPPTLVPQSNLSFVINMPPFAQRSVNFSAQTPPSGSSYSAAIAAQYLFDGQHYASQSTFVLSGKSSGASGSGIASYEPYIPFAVIIVVILIVLALIIRRVAVRKHAAESHRIE